MIIDWGFIQEIIQVILGVEMRIWSLDMDEEVISSASDWVLESECQGLGPVTLGKLI